MPTNNDGRILIHYDANLKELTQVKRNVEKEINNVNASPNIADDFKDEINKIWQAIHSNSSKLENAMNKMIDIELSTKNFEKYQSNVDSIIENIVSNISALDNKLQSLGQTGIGTELNKDFSSFAGHLKDTNTAISEIIETSKEIKSSVILTNDKDISSLNVLLKQLKEERALRKKINEDPATYLDFTGLEDSDLVPYLKSLDVEFEEILTSGKELQKQMSQMDINSDSYKIANAQIQYFRLELQRLVEQYQELYAEIDYRDNLNVPKGLKQTLNTDDAKKFFNSVKAESKVAQQNLEGLLSTMTQTAEVVKKEDLNGSDGAIKVAVKISTSSDTLYRQLIQIIDTLQDKINKRGAIITPVKIVVEGTPYSESKKEDLTDMARNTARQSAEEVTVDSEKVVGKTLDVVSKRIRSSLTSAFENAWVEIIELVKNTILPVYAEVTPETIQSIEDSLKADNLSGAIDFNKGLDEAEEKLNSLSEKAKLLVEEINRANNNDFVSSLGKISDSLNELKGIGEIIQKINDDKISFNGSEEIKIDVSALKSEFDSLNQSILELKDILREPLSLDSQWFNIGSLFNDLADDNGKIDFRKRKQDIKSLIELYEKYTKLGGTNTLSLLTGNNDTLKKLQEKTSYSVSYNAQIDDANSQFKQVCSTLDMVQEKIVLVQNQIKELRINEQQIESFSRLASACDNVLKALTGIGVSTENNAIHNLNSDNFQKIAKPLEKINALTNITTVFKGIKISKNNVDNLKELVPVLKELSDGLKNLDTLEMNGFLSQIQDISKSADNLEHLATIISSSQKELKKVSQESINTPSLDKEITKPIDKILKKIPKLNQEVSKYESSYGKILVQIEEELDKFQSIRNKKILNEEDITTAIEIKNNVVELEASLKSARRLASEASYAKNLLKMQKGLADNSKWAKETKNAVKDLIEEQESLGKNATIEDIRRIGAAYTEIETKAIAAGKAGASFFDAIRNKLKYKWAETFAMFFSFYDIVRYVREVSSAVTELNSNLIELSKVSDTSIGDLYNQFNDFRQIAMDTGNSISDVIKATADWARMGYSLPDAKALAEVAQIYKNVGDGISIDEANEYLISSLQGFQLKAQDAMKIVDVYNEVANNFAIDTAGIGESLERSAASFYAANTSLEESVALVTTANSVLQNPEMVGTTFKTLSARLRGATTELEALGEESTVTTSKLQATVKALTGFDIMEDDGERFKSIYEILVGIGKEWNNLTDIERASLGEMLAGKRNSNALFAVLQNIETLENAYKTAQESSGSALAEQERYMQGIEYSVEQFNVALEDISNDILDSDFAKSVVDFGTTLLSYLDKIIEHPLITLLLTGGIGGLLGLRKISSDGNGGFVGLYGAIYDVTEAYKKYIAAIYECQNAEALKEATSKKNIVTTNANTLANQAEAYSEMQQAQAEKVHTSATEEGIIASKLEAAQDINNARINVAEATTELGTKLKGSLKGLISAPKQILKGFVSLAKAIPALGIGSIIAAIGLAAIKVYNDIKKGEEQLKDSAKELGSQYSNTKNEITSYKNEIIELRKILADSNSSYEESSNARERLLTIQDELISKYGYERQSIESITSAINGQIDALDLLSEREWRRKKKEFEDNNLPGIDKLTQWWHGANSDLGVMLDEMENASVEIKFNGLTNLNDRELAKQIEEILGEDLRTSEMSLTGMGTIQGSLDEVYKKLQIIRDLADEIGASDKAKKSIDKALGEVEDTLDSYEAFYNQYVLQERILGTDYEKLYRNFSSAYNSYKSALISGTEEDAQNSLNTLSYQYESLVDKLFKDKNISESERESILQFFESLYPDIQSIVAQWKLTANIDIEAKIGKTGKTQNEIIEEVINNFGTEQELAHYNEKIATDEQKQAFKDMNSLLAERNISQEDFVKFLVSEGYYLQQINREMSSFSIDYDLAKIEATSKGIKNLQSTYQSLYEAMEEGKEGVDLAFSYSDLDSLKSSLTDAKGNLVDLGDVWSEFYDTMSDGSHTFEEMEAAINKVLTAYVNASLNLENFDKAQADAISTQLQLAGVTKESADAYVEAYSSAASAIEQATNESFDFVNATYEEIDATFNLGNQSEATAQLILAYSLQKKLANGYTISTAADVDNLLVLANAANVSIKALTRYAELKATLAEAEKTGDASLIRNVRRTIDEYVKTIDATSLAAEVQVSPRIDSLNMDRDKLKSSKSGGGSSKESDPWKEAYEKELAALDHLHEMELISDIQYYEEREKLNDKYFKDNTKYTEEYNKNLEEIYKGFQSAYKQYVDDMSDYWKKSLDAGKISFQQYCNNMKSMLDDLHNTGRINDQTYYSELAEYYGTIVENYDKVISAVQRRIKKEIDGLEKEKDRLKENYELRKKTIQSQIDSIQAEIDALEDANKRRQEALDLQKALYDLNRAENQRNRFVYNSDKGFIYEASEADIKEAQDNLEDVRYQQKVSALEQQITTLEEQIDLLDNELDELTARLDKQIDDLQAYSDRWGEVANKYREAQEDMIAAAVLGSNWQNEILALNESTLSAFTTNYINMQAQQAQAAINAANDIVNSYKRQIQALNEWKAAQATAAQTGSSTSNNGGSTTVSTTPVRVNPVKYNAPAQKAQRGSNQYMNPNTKNQRIKQYAYGSGTDNAKPGIHEIAESGKEIVLDNYGNAYLADGHQLHRFEGGEKVYDSNETKELLNGKYIPIDSILPNYTDMLAKVVSTGVNSSMNNINNSVLSRPKATSTLDGMKNISISIGDINVTEVDNAAEIARAIKNKLPNALLQELKKK